MGLARFLRLSQPRHATQLTGSAALLARMRKSRAVTGEPDVAAAPAAAASAREEPSALSAPAGGFDGTFHLLYGGEAATQVAADLAAEARGCGLTPVLLAADEFRKAKLDRRAPYSTLLSARSLRVRSHAPRLMRAARAAWPCSLLRLWRTRSLQRRVAPACATSTASARRAPPAPSPAC